MPSTLSGPGAGHGPRALPERSALDDHGRWRWLEWDVRLWKVELQKLADERGLTITVLHLPPGTSKWNKIEHRLFSFISRNWRGRPLMDYQTIVELIGATTSTTGLTVRRELDETRYPAGIKIPDAVMSALNTTKDEFHGECNYTVRPNPQIPKR